MSKRKDLARIADAVERIADHLEKPGGATVIAPVDVYLDGRKISEAVLRQIARKAAQGPSKLVGGTLTGEKKRP